MVTDWLQFQIVKEIHMNEIILANFKMHDGENVMVILSSPSGVGKTTITKKLQQKYQSFKISVSHTTR